MTLARRVISLYVTGRHVTTYLPFLPSHATMCSVHAAVIPNAEFLFLTPGDNGLFFDRRTTDRELRGLEDFVWMPRWENSLDLSPTQVVLAGVSGAFGSNETGADARTQIYGADFLYKWKSSHAEGGFPFVKWQSEFMYRRFEAGRGIDQTFPVSETFSYNRF